MWVCRIGAPFTSYMHPNGIMELNSFLMHIAYGTSIKMYVHMELNSFYM